jgi:hypothetical protein
LEEQVAVAYDRQRWRKLNPLAQVIVLYSRLPELIAASFTKGSQRLFRLPHWATEATRIENTDDIARLEREFIAEEKEDSLIKKSFMGDKEKVEHVLQSINERDSDAGLIDQGSRLLPGDTVSVSYRCRAPHLYRQKTLDCQYRVTYRELDGGKSGSVSAGETISFYASPFAVPLGAVLGAGAGFIVKTAFVAPTVWFSAPFWAQLAGGALLAIIVAFATSRSPEKKKVITVEDFVGGFVIGAVASLFTEQLLTWLETLVPK